MARSFGEEKAEKQKRNNAMQAAAWLVAGYHVSIRDHSNAAQRTGIYCQRKPVMKWLANAYIFDITVNVVAWLFQSFRRRSSINAARHRLIQWLKLNDNGWRPLSDISRYYKLSLFRGWLWSIIEVTLSARSILNVTDMYHPVWYKSIVSACSKPDEVMQCESAEQPLAGCGAEDSASSTTMKCWLTWSLAAVWLYLFSICHGGSSG